MLWDYMTMAKVRIGFSVEQYVLDFNSSSTNIDGDHQVLISLGGTGQQGVGGR